jgi:hypothetical protein
MAEQPRILLMDCARVIEDEIAAKANQTEVGLTYAMAMHSAAHGGWTPDWPRVNRAILNRWSMAGLERVKRIAHGHFARTDVPAPKKPTP